MFGSGDRDRVCARLRVRLRQDYEPQYYKSHHWTVGVAMFCAAITCWLLDAALGDRKPSVLIDKLTGEKVAFRRSHSLLFIPLHVWALGLAVLGVFFCVRELMR